MCLYYVILGKITRLLEFFVSSQGQDIITVSLSSPSLLFFLTIYLSTLFGCSGLTSSTHDLRRHHVGSFAVVHRFSSCGHGLVAEVFGFRCSMGYGILVPSPGIEPTSSALQGRFLITGPPGKPHQVFFEHRQKQ